MNTVQAYTLGQKDGVTRSRKHCPTPRDAIEEGYSELLKAYNAGWASTASGADFQYQERF